MYTKLRPVLLLYASQGHREVPADIRERRDSAAKLGRSARAAMGHKQLVLLSHIH